MSSRIVETEVVTVRKEAIAPYIGITWNRDNTGTIEFWVSQEVSENGTFVRVETDSRDNMRPLRVNITDILPRTIMVPNPNGAPIAVPCMLLMGAIKQAFDDLYTEAVMAMEVTPTPTPTLTPTPTASTSATPEPTPTPSATVEPTPTPSATVEPTPTPSGE